MNIGDYSLEKKIAASGMMDIYTGRRNHDKLPVTVSMMMKQHVFDETSLRRLAREFDCARSVDSKHVVKYLEIVQSGDIVALVTERRPEMNLKAYLTLVKELPVENAINLFTQLATGLNACHCAGVVHRDVTPVNIFIDKEKAIKVANFGLASTLNATTLTMTGTMIGSPEYAPPENLYSAPRDIRGDIYSLGIIMWEVLTGENPFEGKSITEIIQAKNEDVLPRVSTINPDVPSWLDLLIERMTASDPDKRIHALSPVILALTTQQHIDRPSANASGNCFACGYPLSKNLDFCPYCGKSKHENQDKEEASVILITNIQQPDDVSIFLKHSFHEPPPENLPSILKKPVVPLLENTSGDECRWLEASLQKLGCTVEIRSMPAWYFKLSACILFCILLAVNILLYIKPVSPDPSIQEVPGNIIRAYWLIKIVSLVFISLAMGLMIRLHYAPIIKLPAVFIKGAIAFNPFARYLNFSVGILSFFLVAAASIILMFFASNAVTGLIASFAKWYTDPYWLNNAHYFHRDPFFNIGHLVIIGGLIIIKIIVGRIYIRPIFKGHSETTPDNLHARTDHELLQRLRRQVAAVSSKDFRYVMAESIEQYVFFNKIKERSTLSKSRAFHDLQTQLLQAMEKVATTGDQIELCQQDASEDTRVSAESKQRRIQKHLAQMMGDKPKALLDEWKKAQDQLLRYETALELMAEYLNTLRLIVGGMHAMTVQLVMADQGDEMNERKMIYGMSMLSETLKAIG